MIHQQRGQLVLVQLIRNSVEQLCRYNLTNFKSSFESDHVSVVATI